MKAIKELKDIHEIMEKIYNEEKSLNAEQRVKKLKAEVEKFMLERGLNLKRVKSDTVYSGSLKNVQRG